MNERGGGEGRVWCTQNILNETKQGVVREVVMYRLRKKKRTGGEEAETRELKQVPHGVPKRASKGSKAFFSVAVGVTPFSPTPSLSLQHTPVCISRFVRHIVLPGTWLVYAGAHSAGLRSLMLPGTALTALQAVAYSSPLSTWRASRGFLQWR